MAAQPITNYAKKQIAAQGGPTAIVERLRAGETLAEIARTFFRPDGRAISKRLLDGIMGKVPGMRAAMAQAKRDFRALAEWPRRKQRKAIRANEAERIVRAKLNLDRPMIETESQRTYIAHLASLATERRNPYAKPPAPRPTPPPEPEPPPEPPPRRTDVEWDELRPWCHACESGECQHVKREYMRRAQAYAKEQTRNQPRIIRWLV